MARSSFVVDAHAATVDAYWPERRPGRRTQTLMALGNIDAGTLLMKNVHDGIRFPSFVRIHGMTVGSREGRMKQKTHACSRQQSTVPNNLIPEPDVERAQRGT